MERLQEVRPPATEEGPAELAPLPALSHEALPLLERVEALRRPDATTDEVDMFLAGLGAPLPADEPPRARADLLLGLLEDERLCGLTGTLGRRVGDAALEGLLELGYPYALEVTPEMLQRARGVSPWEMPWRLLLGLGLAVLNVLVYAGFRVEDFFSHLPADGSGWSLGQLFDHTTDHLGFVALLLLGPAVFSALAGWYGSRPVKQFFNAVQLLVGGLTLVFALGRGDATPFLVSGVLSLLTVLCLLPRKEPDP